MFATASRRPPWSRSASPCRTAISSRLWDRRGAARSTLLRCIAGLTKPSRGAILVDDVTVSGTPKEMVYVFQEYSRSLFPWRRLMGNVRLSDRGAVPERRGERRARNARSTWSACGASRTITPGSSRAGCASASRRPHAGRRAASSCCSTSRSARSTRRPAWTCSAGSSACGRSSGARSSSSRTTSTRRSTSRDRVVVMTARPGAVARS